MTTQQKKNERRGNSYEKYVKVEGTQWMRKKRKKHLGKKDKIIKDECKRNEDRRETVRKKEQKRKKLL